MLVSTFLILLKNNLLPSIAKPEYLLFLHLRFYRNAIINCG